MTGPVLTTTRMLHPPTVQHTAMSDVGVPAHARSSDRHIHACLATRAPLVLCRRHQFPRPPFTMASGKSLLASSCVLTYFKKNARHARAGQKCLLHGSSCDIVAAFQRGASFNTAHLILFFGYMVLFHYPNCNNVVRNWIRI